MIKIWEKRNEWIQCVNVFHKKVCIFVYLYIVHKFPFQKFKIWTQENFRELPIVWKSMLEYLQLSISIKNNLKKERKATKHQSPSITINISPTLKLNVDANRDFHRALQITPTIHITKQEIKRNPIKLINQNFQRSIISIEHSTRFIQSSFSTPFSLPLSTPRSKSKPFVPSANINNAARKCIVQ